MPSITSLSAKLPADWQHALQNEIRADYFVQLQQKLEREYATKTVYPPQNDLWTAFALTPLSAVKVVILGQDPYHGAGQAHGLAFSVKAGVEIPPSLNNIYKEIVSDIGEVKANSGNLTDWATQGVLLLNSTLTVRAGAPGSHHELGWEYFTDAVIQTISQEQPAVVFMLWGAHATAKQTLIDTSRHLVLTAPHPSPLSAYRGFFGCHHFSQANTYLTNQGYPVITW